jgi:hypothetical protein
MIHAVLLTMQCVSVVVMILEMRIGGFEKKGNAL